MRLTIDDGKPKKPLAKPEEIIPFKKLSFKQKLQHIWIYYKWHIIVPVALVAAVISVSSTIYENTKDSLLYAVFLNSQFDDETGDAIMNEYLDYADIELKHSRVTLDSSMHIYRDKKGDTNSLASNQKLLAMYTTIEMDVLIGDKDNFVYYAAEGSFAPLSDVLSSELLTKYKDLLVETEGTDGKSDVYGIDVSASPKLAEYKAYPDIDTLILAIPVTHMEDENIVTFIEFLLSE